MGHAQIDDTLLERRCHHAIAFEGPYVVRQHEADIRLLERTVTALFG